MGRVGAVGRSRPGGRGARTAVLPPRRHGPTRSCSVPALWPRRSSSNERSSSASGNARPGPGGDGGRGPRRRSSRRAPSRRRPALRAGHGHRARALTPRAGRAAPSARLAGRPPRCWRCVAPTGGPRAQHPTDRALSLRVSLMSARTRARHHAGSAGGWLELGGPARWVAQDRDDLRDAVRSATALATSGPLSALIDTWHGPAASVVANDDALDEWIAQRVVVSMHAAGSAPMGPDGDGRAVVDQSWTGPRTGGAEDRRHLDPAAACRRVGRRASPWPWPSTWPRRSCDRCRPPRTAPVLD